MEHFGTVLTASPIDLPESGYRPLNTGDFTQGNGAEQLTIAEFEDRCFSRSPPRLQYRRHKARAAVAPAR